LSETLTVALKLWGGAFPVVSLFHPAVPTMKFLLSNTPEPPMATVTVCVLKSPIATSKGVPLRDWLPLLSTIYTYIAYTVLNSKASPSNGSVVKLKG